MVRALHALVRRDMEITLVTEARLSPRFSAAVFRRSMLSEKICARPTGPLGAYERWAQYVCAKCKRDQSQNSRPLVRRDPAHAARLRAPVFARFRQNRPRHL